MITAKLYQIEADSKERVSEIMSIENMFKLRNLLDKIRENQDLPYRTTG